MSCRSRWRSTRPSPDPTPPLDGPLLTTPIFNIMLCGLIGVAAIFLDVTTSTSFINFAAFTAFTLVNLAVIAYFVRHRSERLNPWRCVLLPAVGALIDI